DAVGVLGEFVQTVQAGVAQRRGRGVQVFDLLAPFVQRVGGSRLACLRECAASLAVEAAQRLDRSAFALMRAARREAFAARGDETGAALARGGAFDAPARFGEPCFEQRS